MSQLSHRQQWELANDLWASAINPLLSNPINNSILLPNIALKVGVNVINHGLGHMMTGWQIVDIDGLAEIYRSAPMNSLTLTLTSSAAVNCEIEVF